MATTQKVAKDTAAGLAEIDAWGDWFINAHTERLRAADLSPEQYARDLAVVTTAAATAVEKMRQDFCARYQP